jgi:hypothetical protein
MANFGVRTQSPNQLSVMQRSPAPKYLFEAALYGRSKVANEVVNRLPRMFIRWDAIYFRQPSIHGNEAKASVAKGNANG